MKKKRKPKALPEPQESGRMLVSLPPERVGMFRFLLEGYDNLALFSVLNRETALLKLLYSPHQHRDVLRMLEGIREQIGIEYTAWPGEDAGRQEC